MFLWLCISIAVSWNEVSYPLRAISLILSEAFMGYLSVDSIPFFFHGLFFSFIVDAPRFSLYPQPHQRIRSIVEGLMYRSRWRFLYHDRPAAGTP